MKIEHLDIALESLKSYRQWYHYYSKKESDIAKLDEINACITEIEAQRQKLGKKNKQFKFK